MEREFVHYRWHGNLKTSPLNMSLSVLCNKEANILNTTNTVKPGNEENGILCLLEILSDVLNAL